MRVRDQVLAYAFLLAAVVSAVIIANVWISTRVRAVKALERIADALEVEAGATSNGGPIGYDIEEPTKERVR